MFQFSPMVKTETFYVILRVFGQIEVFLHMKSYHFNTPQMLSVTII